MYLGSYHGSTLKELTFSGSNNALYPQTSGGIHLGLSSKKFGNLELNGSANIGGALGVTGTITGTTATAAGGTNTTALASTAFVQQELTTLIGGAPSTLNDLNELAAAINDDANYNTTLTTALATKLPLAGGTMTGAINAGANNISNINNTSSISFLSTNGYWVGGTQRMNGSGNLLNIGTISSGAITATSNGNDQIHLKGTDTNATAILMDYNGTGSTDRVRIYNNAGGFQFLTENGDEKLSIAKTTGNAIFAGTISSGAVTSTGNMTLAFDSNNSGNRLRIADTEGASAGVRTYSTSDGTGLILNHYYAVSGSPYMRYSDFVSSMGDGAATTMRFLTKPHNGNPTVGLTLNSSQNATFAGTISSGAITARADADALFVKSVTNQNAAEIAFSSQGPSTYAQIGRISYQHGDTQAYGGTDVFTIGTTETAPRILADGLLMFKSGLALKPASGTGAGTTLITSGRALQNITTISSGAITSTGIITSAEFFKATGQNIKFSAGGTHVLNMDVNRKIYPSTHNSTDLGHSDTLAFRNLHLVGAMTGGATISSGAITSSGLLTLNDNYALINAGTTSNTTLEPVLWARSQIGASVVQLNVQGDEWQFGGGGTLDTTPILKLKYGTNAATFAGDVGMATGHSSGKFAVMASSVHGSYDFYNNGTSYLNGSLTVDDALHITGSSAVLNVSGNISLHGAGYELRSKILAAM